LLYQGFNLKVIETKPNDTEIYEERNKDDVKEIILEQKKVKATSIEKIENIEKPPIQYQYSSSSICSGYATDETPE